MIIFINDIFLFSNLFIEVNLSFIFISVLLHVIYMIVLN